MAKKEWLDKGADGLSFGERLGDLIANNKTNATALAKEAGLQQSAISDYLNKDRAPDCGTIYALARHFHVSADYLLGLSSIKSPFADTQAIIGHTGLSEENVQLLESMQTLGLNANLDFLNDLISVSMDCDMVVHYLMMKTTLTIPTFAPSGDIGDVIDSWMDADRMRKRGLVQLSGEEAFHYYCSRIAKALEDALLQKYSSVAEWRERDGID